VGKQTVTTIIEGPPLQVMVVIRRKINTVALTTTMDHTVSLHRPWTIVQSIYAAPSVGPKQGDVKKKFKHTGLILLLTCQGD